MNSYLKTIERAVDASESAGGRAAVILSHGAGAADARHFMEQAAEFRSWNPTSVVNVFTHPIGTEEAEVIVTIENLLIALCEGKNLKAAMVSAKFSESVSGASKGDIMPILRSLAPLSKLCRLMTGEGRVEPNGSRD